jgi:hypothetical protein
LGEKRSEGFLHPREGGMCCSTFFDSQKLRKNTREKKEWNCERRSDKGKKSTNKKFSGFFCFCNGFCWQGKKLKSKKMRSKVQEEIVKKKSRGFGWTQHKTGE